MYDSLIPLLYGPGASSFEAAQYFENVIVEAFREKLEAGISIPTYPQFRDMNEAFLDQISGIKKEAQGWTVTGALRVTADRAKIPEVQAIRRNAFILGNKMSGPIQLRVCITGPYTLSSFFPKRDAELLKSMGQILARFVAENTFSHKDIVVQIVAIDEPVLGFLNDNLLDPGSQGREELRAAWERICREAKIRGAEPLLHLHNTSNNIFWDVDSLMHIESHVSDILYQSRKASKLCEDRDKFVRASIAITDFEYLIRHMVERTKRSNEVAQVVADVWKGIHKGAIDAISFLETEDIMEKRLQAIVDLFGPERVPFAGPECGLKGFPSVKCAYECLRRSANVASSKNKTAT